MQIRKIAQEVNELFPETQGVIAIQSFISTISASRKQMYANNLGQNVVVKGTNQRWIQSGMDTLLVDSTFSIKMPANGVVVKVIPRYKDKGGQNGIRRNPQTIVVYKDTQTLKYGIIDLVDYANFHPYLGFDYVNRPKLSEITQEAYFAKGTIFKDSPGVIPGDNYHNDQSDADYNFSVTCNVALASMVGTAEDGIIINEDSLHLFAHPIYETRIVEFGSKDFPLNIYPGPNGEYGIMPNIGDRVRDDGILMCTRSHNRALSAVEQSVNACKRIDFSFDRRTYADPGGEIQDIEVWHTTNTGSNGCPPSMEEQVMRYDDAKREFYRAIYDLDSQLRAGGAEPEYTDEFHWLVKEAHSAILTTNRDGQKIRLVHKATPIDEWRVKFVIKSYNLPNIGNKFTDLFGGKGVVCSIKPASQMPRDQYGNVADMVFDPAGMINRMIAGRAYEGYFNSASRDVVRGISMKLNIATKQRRAITMQQLMAVQNSNPALFDECWEYLMGYYDRMVPDQAQLYRSGEYGATPISHLSKILHDGHLVLHIPTNHQLEFKNMVADVEEYVAPLFGPVSFLEKDGSLTVTKKPIRIAPMSIIMLEKLADTWSATASGRYQHHGTLATMSNADKHSMPIRSQPTKIVSETEGRLIASYVSPWAFAEVMDRNNNPSAHKDANINIMRAHKPTDISHVINRSKVPIGGSKPGQMVAHIHSCAGFKMSYKPFVTPNPAPRM